LDEDGKVRPDGGGMSVQPAVDAVPFMFAPRKYGYIIEGAAGDNRLSIWRLGNGSFKNGQIARLLLLRVTGPKHGLIEPETTMPLAEFQRALSDTQDRWEVVSWKS